MTHKNIIFDIAQKISIFQVHSRRGNEFPPIRKVARIFDASFRAEDRLRKIVRKTLPYDLSATLVPAAERMVTEAAQRLREDLFALLTSELDAEIQRQQELSAIDR